MLSYPADNSLDVLSPCSQYSNTVCWNRTIQVTVDPDPEHEPTGKLTCSGSDCPLLLVDFLSLNLVFLLSSGVPPAVWILTGM